MKLALVEEIDDRDSIGQTGGASMGHALRTWSIASAKAGFSEVVERAGRDGPQTVTRHGRPAVVVVAAEEWERKNRRKGSLADFFATSPLPGSGIDLERLEDQPRDVDPDS